MKEKRKKNKQLECLKKYPDVRLKNSGNEEIRTYIKECMINRKEIHK